MINDEERSEVVKRLRNGGIARDSEEAYVLLLSCVGIRPQLPATSTYRDAMVRIAGLIDRPTCKDIGDFNHEAFKCSRCGHRVLSLRGIVNGNPSDVVLVTPDGLITEFAYCPNCGAEVVDDG